jgi:hypothetical protein
VQIIKADYDRLTRALAINVCTTDLAYRTACFARVKIYVAGGTAHVDIAPAEPLNRIEILRQVLNLLAEHTLPSDRHPYVDAAHRLVDRWLEQGN